MFFFRFALIFATAGDGSEVAVKDQAKREKTRNQRDNEISGIEKLLKGASKENCKETSNSTTLNKITPQKTTQKKTK